MTYDRIIFLSVFTLGAVIGGFVMWLVMRGRDEPVRTGSAEPTVSTNVTTLQNRPLNQRRTLTDLEPERIQQRPLPPAPSAMGSALESPGITPDATTAVPEVRDHHAIVTRTTPPRGSALYDSFAVEGERGWTPQEEHRLLSLYEESHQVRSIALAMQLDQKQVATRLIRLLLDPKGRMDNDDEMTNSRRRYSDHDERRMIEAYKAGVPLSDLALELGRSQLGLGWRMVDRHIPLVHRGQV